MPLNVGRVMSDKYESIRRLTMVLAEFSMYPLDKGESLSPFVARSLDIIDRSGLPYRCNSMGTVVEGEFDQVMEVIKQCFQAMIADCNRVECSIKLDYRKGRTNRLDGKIASVEAVLRRKINK
jgi:uncharacterized protein (TIGR00106 family)